MASFRPLAGCGLFHKGRNDPRCRSLVSVPLRGVGCFSLFRSAQTDVWVSVPLRGVSCFTAMLTVGITVAVSVPLRGVSCFYSLT